ncbi:MAG: hypothetical protein SFU53_15035 [Terrimicrobiaceae bacterium]|nr:hypothetical protein [Terrimicrobiaceae bacterium]
MNTIPPAVDAFLTWLESESGKPGITQERREHLAQTMCDIANRGLLSSGDDSEETEMTKEDLKAIRTRMIAQPLLADRKVTEALADALENAQGLFSEGYDVPEEFAHGVVWHIRETVTLKLLAALWRQVAGAEAAEAADGEWSMLIMEVTNSVLAPRLKPTPGSKVSIRDIRKIARPEGTLMTGYRVRVDDNSEFAKFNVRWCLGEFELYDDALTAAQAVVESSLRSAGLGKLPAADVIRGYSEIGDEPFIEAIGNAVLPQPQFSAWRFAGQMLKNRPPEGQSTTGRGG